MNIVTVMELSTLQHHDGEVVGQVRLLVVLVVVPHVWTVLGRDVRHDDPVLLLLPPPDQHPPGPLPSDLLVQQEDGERDADVPDVADQSEERPGYEGHTESCDRT